MGITSGLTPLSRRHSRGVTPQGVGPHRYEGFSTSGRHGWGGWGRHSFASGGVSSNSPAGRTWLSCQGCANVPAGHGAPEKQIIVL